MNLDQAKLTAWKELSMFNIKKKPKSNKKFGK
jgi:hypothetical protein